MSEDEVEARVRIEGERDIVAARQRGRDLARAAGFLDVDQTLIAAVLSEVARNIVEHAGGGEVELRILDEPGRRGIVVVARDEGPGIVDVASAVREGVAGRSRGGGLPGMKRLMDDLEIATELGRGTTITMRKWLR